MQLPSWISGLQSAARHFYHAYFSIPARGNHLAQCARLARPQARALDLGCGKTPKNPFQAQQLLGVDVAYGVDASRQIYACDLGIEPLPFPDQHFDFVTAFDLIEHIPRVVQLGQGRHLPFIFLMNEVFRVLKPGGLFLSHTPAYPHMAAFSDPTHVNFITPHTFKQYFCAPGQWASRYGFEGSFVLHSQHWEGSNLVELLLKPGP